MWAKVGYMYTFMHICTYCIYIQYSIDEDKAGLLQLCHGLGPLVPSEERVTANQYRVSLSDHLYPVMKRVQSDGSSLFQDDGAPVRRARGVNERFDEYENDANHAL